MGKQLIDVSYIIENGMITYPGLPGPVISDHLNREDSRSHYATGTEFQIGKIEMVVNTGTYIDSPFHRYADGMDLAGLPLTSLADLEGIVIRIEPGINRAVDASYFKNRDLGGKAVLIHTGWARYWGTEQYMQGHSFLTEDAALFLRDSGAALVGIDSLNIDDTRGGARPVHSTLLAANIPVIEHLTHLEELPDEDFTFFAVPVKIRGLGSFPVRAFGVVKS
jgi:arylformamidase